MNLLTSIKIRRTVTVNGKKPFNLILTSQEQREFYKLIRRSWQNLIERQFKNEGEAIDGQRTGYHPWKDRRVKEKITDDSTYTRRLSIDGKKETVVFQGRPLLQLEYPTLLTRYKRNVQIVSNGKGVYTASVIYPKLITGQGRNAEAADAGIHQLGVPSRRIKPRPLNIPSFRTATNKIVRDFFTKEKVTEIVKAGIARKKPWVGESILDQAIKPQLKSNKTIAKTTGSNDDIPF